MSKLKDLETDLLAKVSSENLWRDSETLAQWEKVSGSPGERAAVDYLKQRMEAIGLRTRIYEFEGLLGWPEEAEVAVRKPQQRDLPVITHALAPSTGRAGIEADAVYAGAGEEKDFAAAQVAGKIALVEGMASPLRVLRGQNAGVAGLVFIQEDRLHDMCVSPVWGTPTTRTASLMPNIPVVSTTRLPGEQLKDLLAKGSVRLWMRTKTFVGWRLIPVVVGELESQINPQQFVLLSGHHCSWYFGAMDNGTANATMLEVARVLSSQQNGLRRTLRVIFWPGHTQGRYSGSAWYCDQFWEDIHDNCVLHINADSTGARGAEIYKALSMPETREFAVSSIQDAIGVEPEPERQSRAGDQSFWACGVPSVYMDLSQVPPELAAKAGSSSMFTAPDSAVRHKPGGLPWWWHTPDDTIDKIDVEVLRRDTQVYLLATWRAVTAVTLPFRYAAAAGEILDTLERYQQTAADRFDLGAALERARSLVAATEELDKVVEDAGRRTGVDESRIEAANLRLMAMDRHLVMIGFTAEGPFDQDLAIPIPAVPLLEPVRRLKELDANSDEAHFLMTQLTRNRNKVAFYLREALRAAQEATQEFQQAVRVRSTH